MKPQPAIVPRHPRICRRTALQAGAVGLLGLGMNHLEALRAVFPTVEIAYVLPVVSTLFVGGLLYSSGHVTLGQVTTVTLYVQQLIDPVDSFISWLDEVQVGSTSLARLVGVAHVPPDREPTGAQPADEHLRADDVRYAYAEGRDVLHGVSAGPLGSRYVRTEAAHDAHQADGGPRSRRQAHLDRPGDA